MLRQRRLLLLLLLVGGAGDDREDGLRLLDARHGDADDAVVEPSVDGLGVAAVGDGEIEAEAAPAVAVDGALPAHDEAPVAVDHLHPDVLLPVPCRCIVLSNEFTVLLHEGNEVLVHSTRASALLALGREVDGERVGGRLALHLVRRLEVLVHALAGSHGSPAFSSSSRCRATSDVRY
uniref:Secreted protein n=1 Tax=Zea mays TaxID=4577 RepID=A0A804PBA6_MAIZE